METQSYNQKESMPVAQSMLTIFSDHLANEIQMQSECIRNIQNKLNCILDKREPEKVDEKMSVPNGETDFSSQFNRSFHKLEISRYDLEKILSHLSEII